ncbi:MAG TPA: MlaD family protein [Solirubrobacterales bacterium]|jgi:phospholipid/cholesterol/gamma-HCH transport system substrate-binding protein
MTEQPRQTSRWKHSRAWLGRQTRGRGKDTIAIMVLAVFAIAMTLWIFTQQKAALPSWAPLVGEDFIHLTAEFSSAQSVTPGQGQEVAIAGVRVGKVDSVEVEEGHAVVGLDIEPEYLDLIHTDAQLLLRPKTALNDMVVQIDPGVAPGHVEDGHNFPISQTEPNVNLEGFLSQLDSDTQQYLQLLLAGGAQGLSKGKQLSGAFRRFQPFAHYLADLNGAVASRRRALANVIHNFALLTTELGRRDNQLERFVTSSQEALGNFANVQGSIQESLVEFPATLATLQAALTSSNRFTNAARPALIDLIPQAQALGPALDASKRFFAETTGPIRDQIRPFTRQTRPVLVHTKQGAPYFNKSIRGFGNSLGAFNSFLNELAYKPKGSKQSFLFYLPWLNHNLNAAYNLTDARGPILRSLVLISCNGASLGYGLAESKPYIKTLLQSARIPKANELPVIPEDPEFPGFGCGPES